MGRNLHQAEGGSAACFDAWRAEGRHACAAGRGYLPTWPVPAPVLTIDHAWLGPGLRAARAEARGSWCSDHRALLVDLELE
ncbi:MAG: hypothetical protein AB7N76_02055 [Planctomycetota bacterium]